jgi:peroxiredoxin
MPVSAPVCDFGWKARDFDLEGVDGRRVRLPELRGPRGTLVMFICNHCPYVKAVIDRLVRDCAELGELGVASIAVMPNDTDAYPEDSFENMKAFAARHRLPFPYAIDRTQEVARAYGAVCTPDFFGFNAGLELQYRGRIDDAGPRGTVVNRRELFEAMKQVAETGRGPGEQVPSMGCSIKWREE